MLSGIPNIIIVESSVVAFLNTSENQYVRLQIQKGLEFLSSDKFVNTAHYDNSVYEPSKMVRIHCDGEDYHESTTFSSWLFVKYDTSYKTYRNKRELLGH